VVREDFSVAEAGEVGGFCAFDAAEDLADAGEAVDPATADDDADDADDPAGALARFWAETGPNPAASRQTRRTGKRKQAPVDATLKFITLEWTKLSVVKRGLARWICCPS